MNFYNQVIELSTPLKPLPLLETIHEIEKMCGRDRSAIRYAPRTLDIDILFYGDSVIDLPELVVPHPRFAGPAVCSGSAGRNCASNDASHSEKGYGTTAAGLCG